MKQKTRDNLIYLAVGLAVASIAVADFLYADTHGKTMWVPSNLSFRAVYTTALLAYFVFRSVRESKATLSQVFAGILFASILNLAVVFTFRRAVSDLPGLTFSALAVPGMFLIWLLTTALLSYSTKHRHLGSPSDK